MPLSADFEQAVISACDAHERSNRQVVGYRRCLQFGDFFVKFDDYSYALSAYLTQVYLANVAKAAPEVHVPEVYHFFRRDHGMAYVVMEHIQLIEVSPEELVQKAAQAVSWMRRVPAPPDVVLGPLGSGPARHEVFKDCEAPLNFTSVEALERFFNTAVAKIRGFSRIELEDINIAHERLVLTQSDMNAWNFGVDDKGRACIFDPSEIGWLSESLADYTLLRTTKFAADVAKSLGTRTSPNLSSMGRVRTLLGAGAPPSLGLDNDGYPKRRKQALSNIIEPSGV